MRKDWNYNNYAEKAEMEFLQGFDINSHYYPLYNSSFFCENCGTRIAVVNSELLGYINRALNGETLCYKYEWKKEYNQNSISFGKHIMNKDIPDDQECIPHIIVWSGGFFFHNKEKSSRKLLEGSLDKYSASSKHVHIECTDVFELQKGFEEVQRGINRIELIETEKSAEDCLKEDGGVICPVCSSKVNRRLMNGGGIHCSVAGANVIEERISENRRNCRDQIDEIKRNELSKLPSTIASGKKIQVVPYLQCLINVEKEIYVNKDQFEYLSLIHLDSIRAANREKLIGKRGMISSIENEIVSIEKEIETLKEDIQNKKDNPGYKSTDIHSDEYGIVKPEEPIYATPGLFNKKKIEKENFDKLEQYKKECAEYESLWGAKKKEIIEEIEKYNCDLDREIHEKEIGVAERVEHLQSDIEEKKKQIVSLENTEVVGNKQSIEEFWKNEALEAKKQLTELLKTRKQLLDLGIIHPKYQDIVIYATFLDYFSTGRVSEFTGPSGAYNLFESETRANTIIGQLNQVIDSLEEIKQNQCSAYMVLCDMKSDLSKIEHNTEIAAKRLDQISEDIRDIKTYSEAIAYNTEKTAYYSKVNAELTDAMGFLIALR